MPPIAAYVMPQVPGSAPLVTPAGPAPAAAWGELPPFPPGFGAYPPPPPSPPPM